MGKRIVLAVFGGIAIFGLIIAIVGFSLGGRPGSFYVDGDNFVYTTGRETVQVMGNMPHWAKNNLNNGLGRLARYMSTGSHTAEYPTEVSPSAVTNYTETLDGVSKLDELIIEIAAGDVVVKTGASASLEVSGPLEYTQKYENGRWVIESKYENLSLFDWRNNRLWFNGEDFTTTFVVTVPTTLNQMDISIGLGEASINGINATELSVTSDMGSITLEDVATDTADFETNLGEIIAHGLTSANTTAKCNMGGLTIDGTVTKEFTAECQMGSIQANLVRPESYAVDCDTSAGSISFDGKSIASGLSGSSSFTSGTQDENTTEFNLECGMGDITVDFN